MTTLKEKSEDIVQQISDLIEQAKKENQKIILGIPEVDTFAYADRYGDLASVDIAKLEMQASFYYFDYCNLDEMSERAVHFLNVDGSSRPDLWPSEAQARDEDGWALIDYEKSDQEFIDGYIRSRNRLIQKTSDHRTMAKGFTLTYSPENDNMRIESTGNKWLSSSASCL